MGRSHSCLALAAAALLAVAPASQTFASPLSHAISAADSVAQPRKGARPVGSEGAAPDCRRVRPVRFGNADAVATVEDAVRLSPTVSDAVARLEQSDLIVWITLQTGLSPATGQVRFVKTTPGARLLMITIEMRNPPVLRMAWLAHELTHALEIADAPEVRDQRSLVEFYRRISCDSDGGRRAFETERATLAGRKALAEVLDAVGRAGGPR